MQTKEYKLITAANGNIIVHKKYNAELKLLGIMV